MCKYKVRKEDGRFASANKTSPVGFGLFALTVDEPQVVLGLL